MMFKKIKKYYGVAALLPLLAVLLVQCDKIEGPVHQAQSSTVDTTCDFAPDNSPARKKVLIEEFTGFLCGNCPIGSVYLNDTLKPQYGDSLIVISVHAGSFSVPCGNTGSVCPSGVPSGSFTTDFKCATGQDWFTQFGVSWYPVGIVDRTGYPTSMLSAKTQWKTKIINEFARAPEARIRIQNTYDDATRKLRTCVETKFINAGTDTLKLQVVLLEDSVPDWQLWYNHAPSEYVENYMHRHILRTDLNGSFGTTLVSGTFAADSTIVSGYTSTINPAWNENHCIVVAFVYDAGNFRVLQAEEMHVK